MYYNIHHIYSDSTLNIEINCSYIEQLNAIQFIGIFIDSKTDWKRQLNCGYINYHD